MQHRQFGSGIRAHKFTVLQLRVWSPYSLIPLLLDSNYRGRQFDLLLVVALITPALSWCVTLFAPDRRTGHRLFSIFGLE